MIELMEQKEHASSLRYEGYPYKLEVGEGV